MEYQNPIPLLKEHRLTPKKDLGQNFLVDSNILTRMVALAEITENSTVLEIGAGLGSLTFFLAQAAKQVTAVEVDKDLLPITRRILTGFSNVTLIAEDILTIDLSTLHLPDGYTVVANIPYYITSAIIRKLLTACEKPTRMVLTMQEEVAERICAQAGKLSLLALSVQVFGTPEMLMKIPAGAFYPTPSVDSVTLRINLFPEPAIPQDKLDAFFKLNKAGFSQKRKMLRNTLSSGLHLPHDQVETLLEQAGIDPQRRAQTLSITEWGKVTDSFLSIIS
ncbi:MAG: 16S rRNA (adenine(1518)-N(6)/adenine(1519)-N(6))-dimethyltransferase RsmA [Anaerolineaceae bacterium]